MAWTFNKWMQFVTRRGTVATVTVAGGIVVGGLLWYERPKPVYWNARDDAELLGGILERRAALDWSGASATYGWARLEDYAARFRMTNAAGVVCLFTNGTNVVGLGPSRYWMLDETYGLNNRLGEIAQTGDAGGGWSGESWWAYLDAAVPGSVTGRTVAVAESNLVNTAWWTSTVSRTAYLLPYQEKIIRSVTSNGTARLTNYTYTALIVTNVYTQIGKVANRMRTTWLKAYNAYATHVNVRTNATVWTVWTHVPYGEGGRAAAIDAAVSALSTAAWSSVQGSWGHVSGELWVFYDGSEAYAHEEHWANGYKVLAPTNWGGTAWFMVAPWGVGGNYAHPLGVPENELTLLGGSVDAAPESRMNGEWIWSDWYDLHTNRMPTGSVPAGSDAYWDSHNSWDAEWIGNQRVRVAVRWKFNYLTNAAAFWPAAVIEEKGL